MARGLRRPVLVATVVALVGVSACYFIAVAAGADLAVAIRDSTPMAVPFGAAVFATVAAGAGAYLLALVAGRTRRPRRAFLVMTLAGLLLSVVPPLQAAVNASTATWLLVMHAAAALAFIPIVAKALPAVRSMVQAGNSPATGAVSTAVGGTDGDR